MIEKLKEMAMYYDKVKDAFSTTTKKKYGEKMIALMKKCPQLTEFWAYNPKAYCWTDRFCQIKAFHEVGYEIRGGIVYDPLTNLRTAPTHRGIYLIGQVTCNPYTDEKQYWVKVGYASDIRRRFASGYTTSSPCTVLIDTSRSTKEVYCHNILRKNALGRCQQNTEWWLVDKKTYLTICEQKFTFFGL